MYESLIEQSHLFHGLPRGCKKEILTRVVPMTLLPGQPVNEMSVSLFVVVQGLLNVHARNGELQMGNLLPGSSFGEVSLLAGRMTYCVTAVRSSIVLALTQHDVQEVSRGGEGRGGH
jgi:CRP-like cAMP-binding protein